MEINKSSLRGKASLVILLIALGIALAAVLLPLTAGSFARTPQDGQVAERDYRAPRSLTYTSEVLTEQRRTAAEAAVTAIYTSPDTRVARRQMEQLRAALAYINSVRADSYATLDQKLADLQALDDLRLDEALLTKMLQMPEEQWQEIQQETLAVLERVMRSSLRPETMVETISRVPAMVSLALLEDQAQVVAALASAYVAPNSQYNEAATQAARLQARAEVEPVVRSLAAGQTIALQGEIFSPEDIEAMHLLGMEQPARQWPELAGAALVAVLMVLLSAFYMRRKQSIVAGEIRKTWVVAGLFLAFLVGARLVMPLYPQVVYAFPLAAYGMTIAALFGSEIAIVTTISLVILSVYGLPDGMELALVLLVTSVAGIRALGRARRVGAFLLAGVVAALTGAAMVLAYRLPLPETGLSQLAPPLAGVVLSGMVAAMVAILLHTLLARLLGTATPIQLVDLTRPDHPLLRILLRDAPGTYQHSLQVSNLVEQAAERIGLDPLLVRVGSLYHDIGKTSNAVFFIENQPPGYINPHDSLEPAESAAIIIRHVTDGLALARKHRLPRRLQDFISEHHGTTLARYQYVKAVKAAGGSEASVDPAAFRYPGPRPQSRETGLLMLADVAEARVRAELPVDEDALRAVVRSAVTDRVNSGQLDDTRLTLRDLTLIIDSFSATLRGVYHPRVLYPKLEAVTAPGGDAAAAPAALPPAQPPASQPPQEGSAS